MKSYPQSNIIHLLHAIISFTWHCFYQTQGDHKFEPPVTQISALQSYYRSREAIFSEIPLWVAIIKQRRTKLLIARYQLFAVSYSERAADFMDVPSFWSKCLQ